jgi:type IV pilus assembly protein PilE
MRRSVTLSEEGFTLIELLVTLAILAVLVAIAVPIYTSYIKASKKNEAKTNLQSLRLLIEQYYAENGRYCPDSSCSGSPYDYVEDDNGTVVTDEITSYNNTTYLGGFEPKSAASTSAVLYNYSISANNTGYTITASPVTSRGAPSGNLTINQDGNKTGW